MRRSPGSGSAQSDIAMTEEDENYSLSQPLTASEAAPQPSGRDIETQHEGAEDQQHPTTSVPVGHWKDGLWDIFRYGYCHCSVLNSCFCTLLAAGQIASRLQLTHRGHPAAASSVAGNFRSLLYTILSYWVTRAFLLIIIAIIDPNTESVEWIEPPTSYYVLAGIDDILSYGYYVFMVFQLCTFRSIVRNRYAIPEGDQCPRNYEDCCCSIFCPCFVAAQMMRHTTDYDKYPGQCCTETGLPASAPSIV